MGALLMALLLPGTAEAGALNLWGAHTGDGVIAVSPYLYLYRDQSASGTLYMLAGINEYFDVISGVGLQAAAKPGGVSYGAGAIELMPRFFPHEAVALALS